MSDVMHNCTDFSSADRWFQLQISIPSQMLLKIIQSQLHIAVQVVSRYYKRQYQLSVQKLNFCKDSNIIKMNSFTFLHQKSNSFMLHHIVGKSC